MFSYKRKSLTYKIKDVFHLKCAVVVVKKLKHSWNYRKINCLKQLNYHSKKSVVTKESPLKKMQNYKNTYNRSTSSCFIPKAEQSYVSMELKHGQRRYETTYQTRIKQSHNRKSDQAEKFKGRGNLKTIHLGGNTD